MDPAAATADPDVSACSLTHALPYWGVINDAMLLADGSYEVGFALQPLHVDTRSTEEMESMVLRLKRLIETLPVRERARFFYAKDAPADPVIDLHEAQIADPHSPSGQLAAARIRALREAAASKRIFGRRLLLSVTYHPTRARPPRRWPIIGLVAGTVALFVGLAVNFVAGVATAALAAATLNWLLGSGTRRPFTPLSKAELEADRIELNGLRTLISTSLAGAGIASRPLEADEYVEWAWRYFNPGRSADRLTPPRAGHQTRLDLPRALTRPEKTRAWRAGGEWMADTSLRQVIARSGITRDPDSLYVDRHVVRIVSVDALPVGFSTMNDLVKLLDNRTRYTVIVDVAREPRAAALARLALRNRMLRSIVETESAPDTASAERGLESTREATYATAGGELEIVRLGIAVVIAAPDRPSADEAVRTVSEFFALQMQDAQVVAEDNALGNQFFALAPFSGRINHRTRAALSITAVHLLPLAGPLPSAERPVMLLRNQYYGLTALDPFDPRQAAWNAVAAGKTGSGKTVFSAIYALSAHAAGTQVVVVDRGSNTPPGPWLSATRYLGGQAISLDPSGGVTFNPCDLPDGMLEPDTHKINFLVTLISRMVSTAGAPLDGYERGIAEAAIRAAYARNVRETPTPDGTRRNLEPVFLHDVVQSLRMLGAVAGTHEVTDEDRRTAGRIAARLFQWVEKGRFAGLVDRPTNVNLESDWIYIDVAALEDNPELMPVMILITTDLIWRHVTKDIGQRRTLVVLDEVWALIADPVAGAFVQDLYRRFRTTGSSVLSISQDIRDFQGNEHALAVLSNCSMYFLFHTESPEAVAEALHLNAREVKRLSTLTAATGAFSEFMVVQRHQAHSTSGVLVLVPSLEDYWLVGSHAHERALRQRYLIEHGDMVRALAALVRDNPSQAVMTRPAAALRKEAIRS